MPQRSTYYSVNQPNLKFFIILLVPKNSMLVTLVLHSPLHNAVTYCFLVWYLYDKTLPKKAD
jgi:hypothetical protein